MSTFYTGVDKERYDAGNKFLPLNRFLLNYTPPAVEEVEETTSYGIPYTEAFTNSGGGGGERGLDLTYNPRAVAEVPVDESIKMEGIEYADDYGSGVEYPNKIINETIGMHPKIYEPKQGLAKIWDMAKGVFKSTPKVRGTLGERLSKQPQIPLPAAMASWSLSPFNIESRNYNPNFVDQLNYLEMQDNMIGIDPNTGLHKYGPDSVLSGKNVISMFGSNDYDVALGKKKDWFENRIDKGKKISWKNYQKTLDEITAWENSPKNPKNKDVTTTTTGTTIQDNKPSGDGPGSWGGHGSVEAYDKSQKATYERAKDRLAHGGRVGLRYGGLLSIL
jgi:hypothetical protein